jgi:pimeloyl-ACP methyl ester carboxylesterase
MTQTRYYGKPPFALAVLHGGPGAPGETAPVAWELARYSGVIEPLQSALSVDGQVDELAAQIEKTGNPPLAVVGWSWGAWLGWLLAARRPELVGKLVLVSAGPFEASYAAGIMPARLARMDAAGRAETLRLMARLDDGSVSGKDALMARLGALISGADTYEPLPEPLEPVTCSHEVYAQVWPEAEKLRASGVLLALGREIRCQVVAIHGDYDPHPADGVRMPLQGVLAGFRFHLLARCGHHPWREKHARNEFFELLRSETTG